MQKNRVNSITYGALFCALVGVLVYANRLMANMIDVYFFWIIPIPVIIYRTKFDLKQTIVMTIAMLLMTMVLAGPISTSTYYVFTSIIAGVVYGEGLMRGKSGGFLIGSVITVSLISMVLTTFVFSSFFGYSIMEEVSYFKEAINEYIASVSGGDATISSALSSLFAGNTILCIIIISSVLTSLLEGVLVHLLAFIVLKRLKMVVPPMKPVVTIFCPNWLKIFVFATFFARLAAQFTSITQYDDILLPLTIVAGFVCFMFGYIYIITILSVRIPDKKKRAGLVGIIVLVSMFVPYVLIGFGIFDMFTTRRKDLVARYTSNVQQ